MFTVFAHEICRQEPQFGKQPREDGYIEDNTHRKAHHHKCGDIRIKRDEIIHIAANLISPQEAESQREYQKIADNYT